MMHRASVHDGKAWRQGLALWFLLLSILTHAVVPAGSPIHRNSGSAEDHWREFSLSLRHYLAVAVIVIALIALLALLWDSGLGG
jgi:hypothetical protein